MNRTELDTMERDGHEENINILFTKILSNNPYHELLFENFSSDIKINEVERYSLFPLLRNALNREVDVIHINWLEKYLFVYNFFGYKFPGYKYIDTFLTVGKAFMFVIDVVLVRLIGIKMVWTVHNKLNHEKDFWRTELLINIYMARTVDIMTVKCTPAKKTIKDIYKMRSAKKIRVVTDGSYIQKYPNTITKKGARNRLGIDEEKFVYLFFGSIREYKGIPDLVSAYKKENPQGAQLWLVGMPSSEKLGKEISSMCHGKNNIKTVFERVPEENIQIYMNASDVVVLPFKDILNSGSVHLAMSFGKPVVAPSIGCVPETLHESNRNRFLYNPMEEDALQEMLRLVQKSDDLERIGNENYRKAKAMSWERSAEMYADIYESLV